MRHSSLSELEIDLNTLIGGDHQARSPSAMQPGVGMASLCAAQLAEQTRADGTKPTDVGRLDKLYLNRRRYAYTRHGGLTVLTRLM